MKKSDQSPKISFEEPPQSSAGRSRAEWHINLAAQLRSRPGEWAKIRDGGTGRGLAGVINRASVEVYAPRGSFEAVSRQRKDDQIDIYARYVGEDQT